MLVKCRAVRESKPVHRPLVKSIDPDVIPRDFRQFTWQAKRKAEREG
jgi:hypothetical protein